MSDGIDAHVQPVQAASPDGIVDRISPNSNLQQLPTPNHSMLPLRELNNSALESLSLHLPPLRGGKCRLGGHAATVAALTLRVVRQGGQMCGVYGPGVRFTAASAVAASASRIVAPSRALDNART